jgi:hypothetical protein
MDEWMIWRSCLMKRWVTGPAVSAFLLVSLAVQAQEPPHLDLVRGLRERGYHELALEHLQKLQKRTQPPLPKELAEVLPLEIAKSQADVAGREKDTARRDALVQQARQSFQDFVSKNPNHALAGDAQLELGRMIFEQARGKSFRAFYSPGLEKAEQARLEKDARADFEAADRYVAEAVKKLKERHEKQKSNDKALAGYLQAVWLLGLNRYEKAMSYSDDLDPNRGETMRLASEAIVPLAKEHRDHSSGLGWLAYALQGRCDWEQDKKQEAQARFKDILAQTKNLDIVLPAQRMARYYQVIGLYRDSTRDRKFLDDVRVQAEAWLKDYAAFVNTRESQHIRYLLARTLLAEFASLPENARKTETNQRLVEQSMKWFDSLTGTDFAALATVEKNQALLLSGRAASRPIAELKSFDDLLLRAQLELKSAEEARAHLDKAENDEEKEKVRGQVREHSATMMQAVRLALSAMPENAKPEDWEKAISLLHYAYRRAGYLDEEKNYRPDPYRMAIVAEYLARNAKKPETGPKAAQAALDLYSQIAAGSNDPADMQRVVAVAELMEKKWPQAPETDAGRDLLARAYFQQQKLREAAALWQKVSPKNPVYASASHLAGVTFWRLHYESARANKKPVTAASPDRDQAIAMLERSIKAIDPAKASDEDKKTYIQAAVALADIYALMGKSEEARKLIDPLADRVSKADLPGDLPANFRPRILGLALRTNVQRRDEAGLKRAMAVLEIMSKLGQEDLGGGFNQVLMEMGGQLKSQIAALEQEGDAAKPQLEQTKESFGKFLDQVRQGKVDPSLQLWLASSYSGIDQHQKAVEILRAFTEPGTGADAQKLQTFQRSQLLLVKALRQAKQFAEADKQLKETMTKREWARKHPEFHKERILLLQDQQKYAGPSGAIAEWTKLIQSLQPLVDRGGVIREVFNESNFHLTFCRYMEARRIEDKQERDTGLKQVAQTIIALEKSDFGGPEHRRRFEELLNNPAHRDLKDVYTKLNGGK